MSLSVYIQKQELFHNKNESFQYLIHTLFLQNYEYMLLYDDPAPFLDYIDYLIFNNKDLISESQASGFDEDKSNTIKLVLKKLRKIQSIFEFYEFFNCSDSKEFHKIFEFLIQRILLVLVMKLKNKNDPSELVNSELFKKALSNLKDNSISDNKILIFIFLGLLKKNCKIYCENKDPQNSTFFVLDEKLPSFFLILNNKNELKFLQIEKPGYPHQDLYEKCKLDINIINFSNGCIKSGMPVNEKSRKKDNDNKKDNDKEEVKKEEKKKKKEEKEGKKEEKEEEEKQGKKERKKEIEEKVDVDKIYYEFFSKLLKGMTNVPDGKIKKSEINETIKSRIDDFSDKQVTELEEKYFKSLKKKIHDFKSDFEDTKMKEKNDLIEFRKKWLKNNKQE